MGMNRWCFQKSKKSTKKSKNIHETSYLRLLNKCPRGPTKFPIVALTWPVCPGGPGDLSSSSSPPWCWRPWAGGSGDAPGSRQPGHEPRGSRTWENIHSLRRYVNCPTWDMKCRAGQCRTPCQGRRPRRRRGPARWWRCPPPSAACPRWPGWRWWPRASGTNAGTWSRPRPGREMLFKRLLEMNARVCYLLDSLHKSFFWHFHCVELQSSAWKWELLVGKTKSSGFQNLI